jgi:TRAP-type C4-dicarboxylate transport system permease small subunit
MIVAALIFFFMLVWGGVQYITAGGDKAQTEAARGRITAALIGLVIVFAAWAIVNLVSIFFGLDLLRLNIPNIQSTTSGTTGD